MSNKNKIAIVFEALGLDKVVGSLSDFTKKLTSTEKATKQTVKATEKLDEETKKLGSSLQKASSEINKTETSTKNLNNTNKDIKKSTEETSTTLKNQANNYKDLAIELENQKTAKNEIKDIIEKEKSAITEIVNTNNEYIDTLKDTEKAITDNIASNNQLADVNNSLSKEIKDATTSNEKLDKSMVKISESAKNSQKGFSSLSSIMGSTKSATDKLKVGLEGLSKVSGGIMLIVTGISKLTGFLGGAISKGKEFSDALDIQNKSIQGMSFAISKNNKLTFESNKSLMDFASELQNNTAYGDEFTMGLIKQGAQAGLNEEEIKRLTKVSLDLATATGGDANTAMKDLTVGMNDVAKLTKIAEDSFGGFTQAERNMLNELQSTGKQAEATAYALERIEKAVGGAAQKEVETFAGKQQQLGNIMGDVKEEFGRVAQALAKPFLDFQTKAVQKFYDILKNPKVVDTIQKIITSFHLIGDVVKSVVVDFVIPHVRNLFNWFTAGPQIVFNGVKKIVGAITDFAGNSGVQFNRFTDYIKIVVGGIINFGDIAMTTFKGVGNAFDKIIKLDFAGAKEEIVNTTKSLAESFKKFVNPDELIKNTDNVINHMKSRYDDVEAHWSDNLVDDKNNKGAEDDTTELKEKNKKMFKDMLKEREAFSVAEVAIAEQSLAFKNQILSDEANLTKDQVKKLNKEIKAEQKILSQSNKDIRIKELEDISKMYADELKKQVANGKKAGDATVKIYDETGKAIDVNILEKLRKVDEEIKGVEGTQSTWLKDLKAKAGEMVSSLSSIAGGINSLIQGSKQAQLESLTEYETAIDTATQKQIDKLKEFDDAWKTSQDEKKSIKEQMEEEESNAYAERLESELQRSLEAGDILSANAIQNKLNELEAEKKKKADEKVLKEKEKTEEDKMKEDRAKLEKQLNYDVAMAEYNKAMAEHGNQVKLAEMESQKAKADAGVSMAQGIAQAAIMPLTYGATAGPVGFALGLAMAASSIGAVASGVGSIKSASANLESVKSGAPTPPKFAYGTAGYSLKQGEEAIVGEAGAERVRNKGGMLEVQSTEATKREGTGGGINIENIIIQVQELTSPEQIIEILKNLKSRNTNYAI